MLVTTLFSVTKYLLFSASSLTCYTNVEATTTKFCNEADGYNTCFASYNKCIEDIEIIRY